MDLRIGTCSWRFPSWHGLVYSAPKDIDYLREYAERYNTVEIDRWFWSLFSEDDVGLPVRTDVERYESSVPSNFQFTVKMPNALTLTEIVDALDTLADIMVIDRTGETGWLQRTLLERCNIALVAVG